MARPHVPGSSSGSAYNDLGFIFQTAAGAMNSKFAGTNGHPSRKSYVGRQVTQPDAAAAASLGADAASSGAAAHRPPEQMAPELLGARTDYLERQEKKLSATVLSTRSQHQDLADEVASTKQAVARYSDHAQQVYESAQFTYGVTQKDLVGFSCDGCAQTALRQYEQHPHLRQKMTHAVCGPHERVLLTYPMHTVQTDDGYVVLMQCKRIHPTTAQMTLHWVLVFSESKGQPTRYVSQFSID